ncbi:glycosyltransferase family 4 protein [Luteimicrobium subarcticum]|uniref:D-inositol 3-phosphate glycosyltransferase n=1 Tax=Luteimicrobium subarcticum TaxID=620910 RepID=A0A2M8WTI7_9MICO|nr:glycosyltransferase family 4 protein [Luteimicrobium subarcticum]PJI94262.1 glycosyltransferase involved in cell wall biosynthesis [Luteimicrobium subarcticum]
MTPPPSVPTTASPARPSRAASLLLALDVLHAQWVQDPLVALVRVLRAAPRGAVVRLARAPGLLGALAAGATGRADEAGDRLRAHAGRGRGAARAAARGAVALHDDPTAAFAWARVGAVRGRRDLRAHVAVLASAGHVGEAVDALAGSSRRRDRRLRDLLSGELAALAPAPAAALQPGLRPGPERGDVGAAAAGPAPTVVHAVTNALPEVQAGYTLRTHGIAAAQVRAGTRAIVVPRGGFPVTAGALRAAPRVVVDGVTSLRRIPPSLPRREDERLAADAAALADLARREGAGVVHAHSSYLNARVALGARALVDVPVVYEVRGFLEETWASRGGDVTADRYVLARASESQAMLAADHVVTISEGMAQDIRDRGVPAERVTVVPNSVDDAFLAPPPDAAALRRRLGIPADAPVVGIVSTLNAYEGVDVLVEAAARATTSTPLHLLVVGDGPERARLAAQAQAALGERAHVVGRVPHAAVREYFAAIDLFAVPRLDLSVTAKVTPIKPLEAMATSRPVVASDLAPLREIVQEGETGWFARPGDADDLARVLGDALADPAELARRGAAARVWVASERTWARSAAVYAEVYAAAASRRRPGHGPGPASPSPR